MDKPTEDTYSAELIAVIKQYLGNLHFDAEFNRTSPSGKPDVIIYYKRKPVAVLENKIPDIRLSDPKLHKQAIRYAKWYKKNRNVLFYGIHNLKFLKLFKYAPRSTDQTTIDEYINPREENWIPISEFPFQIMPWVNTIEDFKQISESKKARENLVNFFLNFKEILENKTIDLSVEVIKTIRTYITEGASFGVSQMESLYQTNASNVQTIFENWRQKRGIQKPKTDNNLRELLSLMIKEQIYTFILKVLFYYVLQGISSEMAEQLDENLKNIELSDATLFKNIFKVLFDFAIEKTGDFEEVFGSNTVERLPFTSNMLPPIKSIISYISQIRWNTISIDIIGRIFETLIYAERRHLLGQHYTNTNVVDLILVAKLKKPNKMLDPSCGSGTFLVRAINYWKYKYTLNKDKFNLTEGVDIDKLAVMLTKINMYIQALGVINNISDYIPNVTNSDIFNLNLPTNYSYVATNPPYTRQEEMTMAFYDKNYKINIENVVSDIPHWSKRASIYAYFLIKAGKLLDEGGRLGFIVENSWINAEYGKGIKKWFLENLTIEMILESNVERWFEEAKINTNIVIAEKGKNKNNIIKFVYLMKPLSELIELTPSITDMTANRRYYESIENLFSKIKKETIPGAKGYKIIETPEFRVVNVKKDLLLKIEEAFGRWGVFKGPKTYLELLFNFIEGKESVLNLMGDVIDLQRGLTTNGNQIFYLPSKHWEYSIETEKDLVLKDTSSRIIKINKKHLRPLIRTSDYKDSPYNLSQLRKSHKEDYVLWVDNIEKIEHKGTKEYIKWAKDFILESNKTENAFPSIAKILNDENKQSYWTKLNDRSGAKFLFKNAIHKNFCIFYNNIREGQVDKRLFLGKSKIKVNDKLLFAVLNSVITYLGMELLGRTNLGEGALDVNVVDYKKIAVLNPIWLEAKLKEDRKLGEFFRTIEQVLNRIPQNIELEGKASDRIKMDRMMLKYLGFTNKNVGDIYKSLIDLVRQREERATSIKREKKKKK